MYSSHPASTRGTYDKLPLLIGLWAGSGPLVATSSEDSALAGKKDLPDRMPLNPRIGAPPGLIGSQDGAATSCLFNP